MYSYVLFMLTRTEPSSVLIINEISTDNIDHQATVLNNNSQKQIEHIRGNKNNIIISSVKMKLIRDRQHSDSLVHEEHVSLSLPITSTQVSSKMESMDVKTANQHSKTDEPILDTKLLLNHPCVLYGKEEKRLACVPCGHLVSCVSCSQKFRTCPKYHREIEAFVRIYI
ncbi:unnamed protein product [Rotaria sordida]|uniref:Uncharacterized protein n=1 Tax=Rotaria sordida TaxID=392033 RepID=A0A815UMV9_9BILA|nr:unnamed protein product [Rotaria sordida]CAF1663304.1 unnamed protein product [Rotaria sordida]